MDHLIDMMLKYPTILPMNSESTEFQGYLPVNGVDYKILIEQKGGTPTLMMHPQLQPFQEEITSFLQSLKSSNVVTLFDGLQQIISSKTTPQIAQNLSEKYRCFLTEYVELREFYISMYKCNISEDLKEIRISHLDEANRIHDMVVCPDYNHTEVLFQVTQHPFPEQKDKLFQKHNSLKGLYEKIVNVIERLQRFFDIMDRLDKTCWVLDPEKPSPKDCYRRIGVDLNVSMVISIDPWSDGTVPDIKFLGPERLVESLRQNVAENLIDWNSDGDVLQEILKLIGLSCFPPCPENTTQEEILLCNTGECCICFSLRLNDDLPEIICQNPSCEQYFHKACLYQWLISVNAKQSFNELNGQCPNCEKHISCPI